MSILLRSLRLTGCLAALALLSACVNTVLPVPQQYDFGPTAQVSSATARQTMPAMNEILTSAALDSNAMLYRLAYDDPRQLKAYAQARWTMPPAQLLMQRVKLQNGSSTGIDGRVLQLELDEFSQIFTAPQQSHAQISVRASLRQGKNILAQRRFTLTAATTTADARGGANAMQTAADNFIAELNAWIGQADSSHP